METLFNGKKNSYSYRSSTTSIPSIKNYVATISSFSMDGVLAVVPLRYKVYEGVSTIK